MKSERNMEDEDEFGRERNQIQSGKALRTQDALNFVGDNWDFRIKN